MIMENYDGPRYPGKLPSFDPPKRPIEPEDEPRSEIEGMLFTSVDERLWGEYGIRPNIPLRAKVEQLHVLWRMDALAISNILNKSADEVELELGAIYNEWKELGRPLTPEEKDLARGQLLSQYTRLLYDIQENLKTISGDKSKLLNLQASILDRRAKMQELDDKRGPEVVEDSENLDDTIKSRVAALSIDDQESLAARLGGL
jgi:hypothetical protein